MARKTIQECIDFIHTYAQFYVPLSNAFVNEGIKQVCETLKDQNDKNEKFDKVLTLAESVIQSAERTYDGNLSCKTVSADALGELEDFITNHCGEDEL
jgi:hypothetical protein